MSIKIMSKTMSHKLDLNLRSNILYELCWYEIKINETPHVIREVLKLRQLFVPIHSMLQLCFILI